ATVLHTDTLRNMPAESKERIFSILLEELGLPREAEQAVRSSIQAAIQATAHHPTDVQAAPTETRVPHGHATGPAAVQHSVGTGMHQALTEPSSPTELSFVPGATSSMQVRMPHASVFNRVMANIWVPLAQFSFEGIAKGLEKGLRSETNKSLMAKLGLEPEMPQITVAEADMSVGEMRMNLENWCVVLDAAAQRWAAQGEQQKAYQLHGDARVWREATQFLFALPLSRNPQSWPAMAAYIARMRENFYASAVGARPDPRVFDSWIWDEVVQTRQAIEAGWGTPSSGAGSAGASSSRGDKGQSSKPFRKGTPSAGQGGGAICVICGRSRSDHSGDFASCSTPPPGRSKPHCKRVGPRRYLVRESDNTSVCMAFNTSSCERHSCRLHECSLCGGGHPAISCPLIKGGAGKS
ncbi:hypothetical protein V8E36_002824, partial [Tilletia maclaganii]